MQDLIVYLAFEQGRLYERIWKSLGLDNVLDFNDILYANKKGAQWDTRGCMGNIEALYRSKITSEKEEQKIKELNEITENIKKLQNLKF